MAFLFFLCLSWHFFPPAFSSPLTIHPFINCFRTVFYMYFFSGASSTLGSFFSFTVFLSPLVGHLWSSFFNLHTWDVHVSCCSSLSQCVHSSSSLTGLFCASQPHEGHALMYWIILSTHMLLVSFSISNLPRFFVVTLDADFLLLCSPLPPTPPSITPSIL